MEPILVPMLSEQYAGKNRQILPQAIDSRNSDSVAIAWWIRHFSQAGTDIYGRLLGKTLADEDQIVAAAQADIHTGRENKKSSGRSDISPISSGRNWRIAGPRVRNRAFS
jgi:hypothetical protein